MVPFAGYEMPVLYTGDLSIKDSHLHTRSNVSIFDVSHMLQLEISGKDRIKFFESLVVADVDGLVTDTGSLTLYTTETGGIIDDLIVNKKINSLYVVSNAARSKEDLEHLNKHLELYRKQNPNCDLSIKILDQQSLLALQGPEAEKALQPNINVDLKSLKFMFGTDAIFDGIPIRVTRCGYTGEDGFEISIPSEEATKIAKSLLESNTASVKMAGLGARDSLRLEAGLCLYGNDIDTTTTPIEASLAWTVAKRRRAAADFLGADVINQQLKDKPTRRRIGLLALTPGPPVRSGSKIYSSEEVNEQNLLGNITSGCPSPSLGQNIAMGYVVSKAAKNGTPVFCEVRGKLYKYKVSKMPFVPTHYYM